MVKELIPHTKNIIYRNIFEEFYDFSDANNYGINTNSLGVIINSVKPLHYINRTNINKTNK